ncbi:MAG TPA: PspA/IM30 family protein [Armatimonadetes bacterium]|nr:PspA/IM30 family protein [Armatimonadota bacterium]
MGIFRRLSEIIKANINDLLSRAEDPEKMLEQMLIEMREQLATAKRQVAVAIADEKKLRKQLDAERANAERWEQRAMQAVQRGNDRLAKEALARRNEHQELARQFEEQWRKQAEAVEQLKTSLRNLNAKIEEAKRKKDLLIARKKRAEAQKAIHETLQGLSDTSAFDVFARMEQKILDLEARAEASAELAEEFAGDTLEREFERLEAEPVGLEADLAELKQRMGMVEVTEEEEVVERKVEI